MIFLEVNIEMLQEKNLILTKFRKQKFNFNSYKKNGKVLDIIFQHYKDIKMIFVMP